MERYLPQEDLSDTASIDTAQFADIEFANTVEMIRKIGKSSIWGFTTGGSFVSVPAEKAGVVFAGCCDHNLYAIDLKTGRERWRFKANDIIVSSPAIWNNLVLFGSYDKVFYALETKTGKLAWKFQTNGKIWCCPRVHNDMVLFGSEDHTLYCLDASTGGLRWKFPTNDAVMGKPLVHDGRVYAGSFDKNLYCLSLDGKLIWRFPTKHQIWSSPAAFGSAVYTGSGNHNLYAVDARTGKLCWTFPAQDGVYGVTVAPDGVFFGSRDNRCYALSHDGKPRWTFRGDSFIHFPSPPINGAVYGGMVDGTFFALDARTGKPRWTFRSQGPFIISDPPLVAGGMVFAPCWDGNLYALDAATGKPHWQFRSSLSHPARIDLEAAGLVKPGQLILQAPEVTQEEEKYKEHRGEDGEGGRSVYTFKSQYIVKSRYGTAA